MIAPRGLADALIVLIGFEAKHARRMADCWASDVVPTESPALAQDEWEQDLAEEIEAKPAVPVTEKRQVILARRGQGELPRAHVAHRARLPDHRVNWPELLMTSHCKPWRDCESNDERLDGENGLLLTPTVDYLFYRGPEAHGHSARRAAQC